MTINFVQVEKNFTFKIIIQKKVKENSIFNDNIQFKE